MLFKEIIGQETVKKRLVQSARDNRISHAQLFLGPEGSGALAIAIAYAQYIACTDKGDSDSCGVCPSCIKFAKLIHPDLHFSYPVNTTKEVSAKPKSIDFIVPWRAAVLENPYLNLAEWLDRLGIENKQGNISVEESADILRKLSLKTFESEFKIMIIWLPEKMNAEAANKLLKIIEEPPDKTLFILVSENQELLLPTILSRTQLVKVNRLSDTEMQDAVMSRYGLSLQDARRITHLADGNYHEARMLAAPGEEPEDHADVFLKWMRLCYSKNIGKLIEWSEISSKTGREKQKNFLMYSLHLIRECLLLHIGEEKLVRLDGDELISFKKMAPFVHSGNSTLMAEELNKACFHIERNANARIVLFDLSLKMISLLQVKETEAAGL